MHSQYELRFEDRAYRRPPARSSDFVACAWEGNAVQTARTRPGLKLTIRNWRMNFDFLMATAGASSVTAAFSGRRFCFG